MTQSLESRACMLIQKEKRDSKKTENNASAIRLKKIPGATTPNA